MCGRRETAPRTLRQQWRVAVLLDGKRRRALSTAEYCAVRAQLQPRERRRRSCAPPQQGGCALGNCKTARARAHALLAAGVLLGVLAAHSTLISAAAARASSAAATLFSSAAGEAGLLPQHPMLAGGLLLFFLLGGRFPRYSCKFGIPAILLGVLWPKKSSVLLLLQTAC